MSNEEMIERARAWTVHETAHINGGKAFFAYRYRCDQEPRLTLFKRYDRKLRTVSHTWQVDGVDQISFEVAVLALEGVTP